MRKQYKPTATRLVIAMAMAVLLHGGPALAQVDTTALPTIGTTSPLGALGSAPAGPAGIPLGAVELSPAGLSPMPLASIGSGACSGVGMASSGIAGSAGTYGSGSSGSYSSFDGGGMSGAMSGAPITTPSTISGACGSMASGGSSSGTSAMPSVAAGPSSSSAGIPLGSTEVSNLGISPIVVVPGQVQTLTLPASPTIPTLSLPAPQSSAPAFPLSLVPTGTSGLGAPCGSGSSSTGRASRIGVLSLRGGIAACTP
jgi:hypothetical protein